MARKRSVGDSPESLILPFDSLSLCPCSSGRDRIFGERRHPGGNDRHPAERVDGKSVERTGPALPNWASQGIAE